jgi:hypothetical protein
MLFSIAIIGVTPMPAEISTAGRRLCSSKTKSPRGASASIVVPMPACSCSQDEAAPSRLTLILQWRPYET